MTSLEGILVISCATIVFVFVSIPLFLSLEALTLGNSGDTFCGVHHAPFACVGLTVWFTIIWRVQFVSPSFWTSRFFVNTTCNLLVKMSKSVERIFFFSFGFCFPNFHPLFIYSSSINFYFNFWLEEKKSDNELRIAFHDCAMGF